MSLPNEFTGESRLDETVAKLQEEVAKLQDIGRRLGCPSELNLTDPEQLALMELQTFRASTPAWPENEVHKAISPLLSKRDQGRVMGALRDALPICKPRRPYPTPVQPRVVSWSGAEWSIADLADQAEGYATQPPPGAYSRVQHVLSQAAMALRAYSAVRAASDSQPQPQPRNTSGRQMTLISLPKRRKETDGRFDVDRAYIQGWNKALDAVVKANPIRRTIDAEVTAAGSLAQAQQELAATRAHVPERLRDRVTGEYMPLPENVRAFYQDLFALYVKHDLSLAHEDGHGAFLLERFDPYNVAWVAAAPFNLRPPRGVAVPAPVKPEPAAQGEDDDL